MQTSSQLGTLATVIATTVRAAAAVGIMVSSVLAAPRPAPDIDVWYGDSQSFGVIGQPQPWVNVLGNISDTGGGISLEYTLNGGAPVDLTIGPDGNRLVEAGDFNIDLATADLVPGANVVTITSRGGGDSSKTRTVTVDYQPGTVWPSTYAVDWSSLSSVDQLPTVSHVVDGKWALEAGNVRTVEPGYDRLIAIGDVTWDDYEVTVPVTIHQSLSDWLGVGILFRWSGHTDNPIVCDQPKCGWLPLGSICWYREGRLEIYGNRQEILGTQPRTLSEGVTYWFKARVETNSLGGLYSFKVWEVGESEPVGWDVTGQEDFTDPQAGSMMLLTHRADVSFGNVVVTDLDAPSAFPPVARDDAAFVLTGGSVDIPVLANDSDVDGTLDPATVTILTPPAHGSGSVDPATGRVTYDHDGSATTTDTFSYTVADDDGLVSAPAAVSISIAPDAPTAFTSDDFSGCVLDPRWTFVNPRGDGAFALAQRGGDAVLALSLPAGAAHDAWGSGGFNETARVMQPTNDVDFEIEVKFLAEPTGGYNDQGILIEEDADNWLRFDVYHSGSTLKAFMGSIITGAGSTIHLNAPIATGSARFIRVRRAGDEWTMFLSGNGTTWSTAGSFTQALIAREVGVYAGNPVGALAFTSDVDYVFHTASPISPEDDVVTLPAPSGLAATAAGFAIDLAWTDNSVGEDGFTIERDAGAGFQIIDQVATDVTTYRDDGLDCDTGYGYRVSAFGCAASSDPSEPATATTDACPGAATVHVAAIDVVTRTRGPWTSAEGVVTVVDETGTAREGASVTADWSGSTGPTAQVSVTDAGGRASFRSDRLRRPDTTCWTLTVREVTGSGFAHDATADVETSESAGSDCPAGARSPGSSPVLGAQPNPFGAETTISFLLSGPEPVVTVTIFDTAGRVVRELMDGELAGGVHRVEWDGRTTNGRRAAPGIYFYRVSTPRITHMGKLVRLP